jgi:hypothetical protein
MTPTSVLIIFMLVASAASLHAPGCAPGKFATIVNQTILVVPDTTPRSQEFINLTLTYFTCPSRQAQAGAQDERPEERDLQNDISSGSRHFQPRALKHRSSTPIDINGTMGSSEIFFDGSKNYFMSAETHCKSLIMRVRYPTQPSSYEDRQEPGNMRVRMEETEGVRMRMKKYGGETHLICDAKGRRRRSLTPAVLFRGMITLSWSLGILSWGWSVVVLSLVVAFNIDERGPRCPINAKLAIIFPRLVNTTRFFTTTNQFVDASGGRGVRHSGDEKLVKDGALALANTSTYPPLTAPLRRHFLGL